MIHLLTQGKFKRSLFGKWSLKGIYQGRQISVKVDREKVKEFYYSSLMDSDGFYIALLSMQKNEFALEDFLPEFALDVPQKIVFSKEVTAHTWLFHIFQEGQISLHTILVDKETFNLDVRILDLVKNGLALEATVSIVGDRFSLSKIELPFPKTLVCVPFSSPLTKLKNGYKSTVLAGGFHFDVALNQHLCRELGIVRLGPEGALKATLSWTGAGYNVEKLHVQEYDLPFLAMANGQRATAQGQLYSLEFEFAPGIFGNVNLSRQSTNLVDFSEKKNIPILVEKGLYSKFQLQAFAFNEKPTLRSARYLETTELKSGVLQHHFEILVDNQFIFRVLLPDAVVRKAGLLIKPKHLKTFSHPVWNLETQLSEGRYLEIICTPKSSYNGKLYFISKVTRLGENYFEFQMENSVFAVLLAAKEFHKFGLVGFEVGCMIEGELEYGKDSGSAQSRWHFKCFNPELPVQVKIDPATRLRIFARKGWQKGRSPGAAASKLSKSSFYSNACEFALQSQKGFLFLAKVSEALLVQNRIWSLKEGADFEGYFEKYREDSEDNASNLGGFFVARSLCAKRQEFCEQGIRSPVWLKCERKNALPKHDKNSEPLIELRFEVQDSEEKLSIGPYFDENGFFDWMEDISNYSFFAVLKQQGPTCWIHQFIEVKLR